MNRTMYEMIQYALRVAIRYKAIVLIHLNLYILMFQRANHGIPYKYILFLHFFINACIIYVAIFFCSFRKYKTNLAV